jgi:hypothetical protein
VKLVASIVVGILAGLMVATLGAVAGGFLALAVAELVYGNKEPMIPMLAGGLLGSLLGIGGGIIFGVFSGTRVYGLLNRT